jgi:DNA transformation protein
MPSSPDFVSHVLDLLAGLGPVEARRMFGGHGLFHQGLMFAILDDDELYLKADEQARPRFVAAGCRQWSYSGAKGTTPMGYWRPPDGAHEGAEAMLPWAILAAESALRKAAARAGTRPAARGPPEKGAARKAVEKAPAKEARPAKGARAKRPARQSRR